jgi:hypothetical protein
MIAYGLMEFAMQSHSLPLELALHSKEHKPLVNHTELDALIQDQQHLLMPVLLIVLKKQEQLVL